MNQTMTRLQKLEEQEYTPFMRVLFGQAAPSDLPTDLNDPTNPLHKLEWIDPSLNDSQKEAIRFALASREVALIHGPPGTGKTHTLIELVLQLLKQGLRLLVCGPSNISVDNIVERLASHKVNMVRLGHPARLLPSVLSHSLDVLTRTSEAAALVQDVRKEMDDKQASIRKTRNARERRQIYTELKELRQEYRERERACVGNLVGGSKVVLATLHGAGGFHLKGHEFDVVIIDEASQALEAQCWVPLLWVKANKLVLAGDHLQLPPTIKSLHSKEGKKKEDGTLETTLFDRLLALHGAGIKRMLTTQYRMHEKIMRFPSDEMYGSQLVAAESVKKRVLKDLAYGVQDTEDTREAVVFWDTQGGDFGEKIEDEGGMRLGDSKSNLGEAALVKMHVKRLIEAGVQAEDIAVVTPYNGQVRFMRMRNKRRLGVPRTMLTDWACVASGAVGAAASGVPRGGAGVGRRVSGTGKRSGSAEYGAQQQLGRGGVFGGEAAVERGHDAAQAAPVCDRRLGDDEQVSVKVGQDQWVGG
jgi:DNA polymerase alpha-associated DNA helicase A